MSSRHPGQTERVKRKPEPKSKADSDLPVVVGVRPGDLEVNEDDAYRQACARYARVKALEDKANSQSITFEHGPIALAAIADLHLGGEGVNYERLFNEGQIIADTPGMHLILAGDLLDNFILEKMMSVRFDSHITIPEEWALVRRYLRIVAPKLVAAIRGNHEGLVHLLSGIDYFRDALAGIAPGALYDRADSRMVVKVGKREFPLRARHRWRGNSIYNLSHSIERAFLFDQDFLIGIGAHTHASGLARQFNAAGQTGMALLCGAYKEYDEYAHNLGFPKPNRSAAVAVILDECGAMVGFDRLDYAAKTLGALRDSRKKDK